MKLKSKSAHDRGLMIFWALKDSGCGVHSTHSTFHRLRLAAFCICCCPWWPMVLASPKCWGLCWNWTNFHLCPLLESQSAKPQLFPITPLCFQNHYHLEDANTQPNLAASTRYRPGHSWTTASGCWHWWTLPEDVTSVLLDCMCFPDALESQKRAADLLGLEL